VRRDRLDRQEAVLLDERMLAGSEWHDEDLRFAQVNGRSTGSHHDDWTLAQKAGACLKARKAKKALLR
jgi:hypothetical protein